MNYKNITAVIAYLLFTAPILSQNLSFYNYESFEDLTEEIFSATDMEVDYTTLFEDLYYYHENPLNINTAGYNDLKKLYILTDFQIQSLLDYIKENDPILSIYELEYVYGFSEKDIRFLIPFVSVQPVRESEIFKPEDIRKHGQHEVILRAQRILENQKGYLPVSDSILNINPNTNRYLGDPNKIYARYKYNLYDRIFAGITAEKDAGEEFFKGNNSHRFDFYSAYLQLSNFGMLKKIHIGDYHLQFGQGLTLWSGLAFGKTAFAANIKKREAGIKRYTSADENIFFRGAASTLSIGDINVTLFYSRKKRDANIIDTIGPGFYEFSSFQTTGYHRTPAENFDEKVISETAFGANLSLNKKYWSFGTTFINYKFGGELKESDRVYKRFDFTGDEITNIGANYEVGINKINLFGEVTIGNNSWGMIHGAMLYMSSMISFSAFYRIYQKDFYTHYGNALSENTSNSNETGFYIGTETHPFRYWKISAYADIYKFPWLKYNISAPSTGADYFIQLDFTPDKNFEAYLRINSENKFENNTTEDTLISKPEEINKLKVRVHFSYSLNDNLQLRNRIEINRAGRENESPENGYLLYQDIIYKIQRLPVDLYFRYAFFDTDTYYSRIYAYENDLLYSYSIPPLYYRGMRSYIMLKYSVARGIDLWLKYSRTTYSNSDFISSGLSEIKGNTKSEIKLQLRVKF
jgi:hypothetical protein